MSDTHTVVRTVITSTIGPDETHHEVEVATGGLPLNDEALTAAVIRGCEAAIGVTRDHVAADAELEAHWAGVTAEREQDFESGSEQEG